MANPNPCNENKQLTGKQKEFVRHYLKCKNATQSALLAYETVKRETASVIGARNLQKPNIKKTIDDYLKEANYSAKESIVALQEASILGLANPRSAKVSDTIRANEILLKLSSNLIDRKQTTSLSFNVSNLDKNELLKLKDKYDKLIKS